MNLVQRDLMERVLYAPRGLLIGNHLAAFSTYKPVERLVEMDWGLLTLEGAGPGSEGLDMNS